MNKQTDNGFELICKISDLPANRGKRFLVDETEIALFKIGNKVFAVNNVCPHQHFSFIYDGTIDDGCVTCPLHGWRFELKTGNNPAGGKGLDSYPVKIVNEEVFVKVVPKEQNW